MTTSKTPKSKKDKPYAGHIDLTRLFGTPTPDLNSTKPTDSKTVLAIEQIHRKPEQVRRYFDPEKMEHLIHSIQEHGILENLVVRPLAGQADQYELVAGERRYRAAQAAALTEVPVIILDLSDQEALHITLVENLQREDLNPVEETEGILQLLSIQLDLSVPDVVSMLYRMQNEVTRNLTHNIVVQEQKDVVEKTFYVLGRMSWQSFVKHRLPLRNLPDEILTALQQGQIAYTKAQAIAKVKDPSQRQTLLQIAISNQLSLTQIKTEIGKLSKPKKPKYSQPSLRERMDVAYKLAKKSNIWDDPKHQGRLEKLLSELETLLKGTP